MTIDKLIEQFRNDPIRVEEWRAVLAMQITKEVLTLINIKGPKFARAGRISWSAVDVGIAFGGEEGFRDYAERLEEMAEISPLKRTLPDPPYAPPDPNEEQE